MIHRRGLRGRLLFKCGPDSESEYLATRPRAYICTHTQAHTHARTHAGTHAAPTSDDERYGRGVYEEALAAILAAFAEETLADDGEKKENEEKDADDL